MKHFFLFTSLFYVEVNLLYYVLCLIDDSYVVYIVSMLLCIKCMTNMMHVVLGLSRNRWNIEFLILGLVSHLHMLKGWFFIYSLMHLFRVSWSNCLAYLSRKSYLVCNMLFLFSHNCLILCFHDELNIFYGNFDAINEPRDISEYLKQLCASLCL